MINQQLWAFGFSQAALKHLRNGMDRSWLRTIYPCRSMEEAKD
jgi:hypothetical protein